MDLFDYVREQNMEKESPLASRLRPTGRTSCCTEQLRQIRSVPLSSTDRRERARPPWRR